MLKRKLQHHEGEAAATAKPEEMKLDDARRVKVLSPGMLVYKRFIRNKLAIAGTIILVVMALFSIFGPMIVGYSQDQHFRRPEQMFMDWAQGSENRNDWNLYPADSSIKVSDYRIPLLNAVSKEKKSRSGLGADAAARYELPNGTVMQATDANGGAVELRVLNGVSNSYIASGELLVAIFEGEKLTFVHDSLNSPELIAELEALNAEITESAQVEISGEGYRALITEGKIRRLSLFLPDQPLLFMTLNAYLPLGGKDTAALAKDFVFISLAEESLAEYLTTFTYEDIEYTLDYSVPDVNLRDAVIGRNITLASDGLSDAAEEARLSMMEDETVAEFMYNTEKFRLLYDTEAERYHIERMNGNIIIPTTPEMREAYTEFLEGLEPGAQSDVFTWDGFEYRANIGRSDVTVLDAEGAAVMHISDLRFGALGAGMTLPNAFILQATEAYRADLTGFTVDMEAPLMEPKETERVVTDEFGNEIIETTIEMVAVLDEDGNPIIEVQEVEFLIRFSNELIYFQREETVVVLAMRGPPSKGHLLGTDVNGMDVLSRLMYGGRVSMTVGFAVIFIELLIGVIIGGIAGFYGGWVDNALMRFVDLFNSIPAWPMYIIIGSVLDALQTPATQRLFYLMALLGLLGWTGIARMVRGQILTLREQEFMVATEATGIRAGNRIFKHLVPNVMPLLIVSATMGLGEIILFESTLSFLGLGVKYPMASWGAMITQAEQMYIMRTCWFIWVPAGCLILLTVLGFNFVGDGLRDAFDPKMKR